MRKMVVAGLTMLFVTNAIAANWVTVPQTEAQVDVSRIGRDRDGYVHIWTKVIYSAEIINNLVRNAREHGQNKDYSNYSHSIDELVVNCRTYQYFHWHGFDYSTQGKSISSTEFPFTGWQAASPDSVIEHILRFGCKRAGKG